MYLSSIAKNTTSRRMSAVLLPSCPKDKGSHHQQHCRQSESKGVVEITLKNQMYYFSEDNKGYSLITGVRRVENTDPKLIQK